MIFVWNYILWSLSQISHVGYPSFITLVNGLAPHVNLSGWMLSTKIDAEHDAMVKYITKILVAKEHICIAADTCGPIARPEEAF